MQCVNTLFKTTHIANNNNLQHTYNIREPVAIARINFMCLNDVNSSKIPNQQTVQ
jgi:hypothetical protein